MSVSVEVKAEKVIQKLSDLKDTSKIEDAIEWGVLAIEREAKGNINSRTGTLRSSIQGEVTSDSYEVVGEVGTPLVYGNYVEHGTGLFAEKGNGRKDVPWFYKDAQGKGHLTSGQKPQHFLKNAFDDNKDEILKRIEGVFKDG